MDAEDKLVKSMKGALLSINLDDTQAFLKLVPAELEGQLLTAEQVYNFMAESGIVYGIKHDVIKNILANPVSGEKVAIAEGEPSTPGGDAEIEYLFNTSNRRAPTINESGIINYKDLNFIQSAKAGQVLARKTPPLRGTPGKSIFGKEIPAKPGRDRAIGRGANTELSSDGLTLTSTIEGTISFKSNIVSIQPTQSIPGSVDAGTGNINCLGSLKIQKNICSEFKVAVGDDLEVGGNVEDAIIDAGGNVLIKGGFFGGGKGVITAKGDVTVRYVEQQKIRADGTVYVGGVVLNCDIYAGDSVVVQGKSSKIAGGNVAAKRLVRVATLGNDAGVLTHVHVAYDMKTVERLREVTRELERLTGDEKRVKDAMVVLYRLEMNGKLPSDKKEVLQRFKQFTKELPAQREALQKEHDVLRISMQELSDARVVVEERIHAGSVIHFGAVYKEINEDVTGGYVFEKTGDSITRSPLNQERERQFEEQMKRTRQAQSAKTEAPALT